MEKNKFESAAKDVRYLLNRGYPKTSTLRFVCNHYCLNKSQRNLLSRLIVPDIISKSRHNKKLSCKDIKGASVVIDGYNLIITVDSILTDNDLWKCNDGFVRDNRGIFRNYKISDTTYNAIETIITALEDRKPSSTKIILDSQMSKSGLLADHIRNMVQHRLPNTHVCTSSKTDYHIKMELDKIIITSDGIIIDSVNKVIDLAECIAIRKKVTINELNLTEPQY
ncbi:DUF434 domain-containing protein [Methanosalsum natronophilum]|uniref:DUF434 domain-containing protein n=1 Tax=Methanosalsum natronophilum TaxID=768733 RepID=UPI002168BCAD|nr:DUF434 domain-containing protein [Methanosalsum natronophilum]MCS3923183.1 hypothetical protein [Methanosalsum natronophilum]